MKTITSIIFGFALLLSSAILADLDGFDELNCMAFSSSTCVDEREDCGDDQTIYTFSCGSDIYGNQDDPECYICIDDDVGEN